MNFLYRRRDLLKWLNRKKSLVTSRPLTFLLIFWASSVFADGWDAQIRDGFLLPLTYPSSEWRADDFGEKIPEEAKSLVVKFKPNIYIAPDSFLPIDFYQDYLPNTEMIKNEKLLYMSPNRKRLKKYERDPNVYLKYNSTHKRCNEKCDMHLGALYSRVYVQNMRPPKSFGGDLRKYLVLKYTAVFSSSGLPAKLTWSQNLGAKLIGDPEVWHELDIHGAIHILVNVRNLQPEILLLAQHNHFRSYVIGRDVSFKNGRLNICFAQRSNEPYPCPEGPQVVEQRASGDPSNFAYVLTGKGGGLATGVDLIYGADAGAVLIDTYLEFLKSRDPLYVSWISLGDRKKIWGIFSSFFMHGPPGIDLNTHPSLRSYTDLAKFWYFEDDDELAAKMVKNDLQDFFQPKVDNLLEHNGKKLWQRLSN